MKIPDLEKTVATIQKWITTSTEDDHLDLCEEAITKFVERRFFLDPIMPFLSDALHDRVKHMRSKINSLHLTTQNS